MSTRGTQLQIIQQADTAAVRLPAGAQALLGRLFAYADESGACWPSHATLARDLQASRSSVIRWINRLASCGWLAVTHTGRSSRYQILFEKIECRSCRIVRHQMSQYDTSDVPDCNNAYKEGTKPRTKPRTTTGGIQTRGDQIETLNLTPPRTDSGMSVVDQKRVLAAACEAWGWMGSKRVLLEAMGDGLRAVGDPEIGIKAVRQVRAMPKTRDPVGEVIAVARELAGVG